MDTINKYNKNKTELDEQLTNQTQHISRLQDKVKANMEVMLVNENKARELQQALDDAAAEREGVDERLTQTNTKLVSTCSMGLAVKNFYWYMMCVQ